MKVSTESCNISCNMLVPGEVARKFDNADLQSLCLAVALVKADAPVSAVLAVDASALAEHINDQSVTIRVIADCAVSGVSVKQLIETGGLAIVADAESPLLEDVDGFDECTDSELDEIIRSIEVHDTEFEITGAQ